MLPILAVCAIMRDEAPYIREWLAAHILAGVTFFRIYDNESTDGSRAAASISYPGVNVEVLPWPQGSRNFNDHQKLAYEDALANLRGRADFLAFIDVDEFLYCLDGTLPEALASYRETVGAIAVQQTTFGSAGHEIASPDLVVERFNRCGPDFGDRHWFKTIAHIRSTAGLHSVHTVSLTSGVYVYSSGEDLEMTGPPGRGDSVRDGAIRLNHYILKSLEEFRAKQRKWAANQPDIAHRFSESYFFDRDRSINAAVDNGLASRAADIRAIMASFTDRP